jgi:hypothetical protein
MAEIRTVTTLRKKRDEVRRAVRNYERKLDQARSDLAHLIAAISIFEANSGDESLPAYSDLHRLFRYGEAFKLCSQALASGPKTTPELAVYVAKAKGLDAGDAVMRRVIGSKLIHSLRIREKQGQLVMEGKRKGRSVWRLPDTRQTNVGTNPATGSNTKGARDLFHA